MDSLILHSKFGVNSENSVGRERFKVCFLRETEQVETTQSLWEILLSWEIIAHMVNLLWIFKVSNFRQLP